MEENNRKFRAPKPLRALHQNNIIWKRKRTSQDNGELTFKRLKHCSPINEETMMELDAREGKRDSKITCIFCRQWSGGLEDFAWHVEQAHGIPAHVGKCLVNKLMVRAAPTSAPLPTVFPQA